MKSTIINTSKEMMAYSDFPPSPEFPNYMHNSRVMEYFRLYAEKFQLMSHIKFNFDVLLVKRAPDYQETGRWELKIRDQK